MEHGLTEALLAHLAPYYSVSDVCGFVDALQRPPLCTTLRVNTLKGTVEDALTRLQSHFHAIKAPFAVKRHVDFADVLQIQAIGPVLHTPASKEIVVDTCCGAALLRGANLYTAGIIGMEETSSARVAAGDKVSVWADLEQRCLRGSKRKYEGRRVFIGNGVCQVTRADVFREEQTALGGGVGVVMTETEYRMPALNGVLSEWLFLQNLPSIAASVLLNPKKGSRVLDLCASPGGKTCHLAAIMENTGKIVAIDKSATKTQRIRDNCRLLGVENVEIVTADSTRLLQADGPFAAASFDYILLDPPCSGLGQRPNLLLLPEELRGLADYAVYQERLFRIAWSLLAPGGELVYSTCTVNPLENEILIDKMLATHPDAQLLPIRTGVMERHCLPGLRVGGLTDDDCRTSLCRFWPSTQHDYIGFFIAKLQKSDARI